MSNVRMMLAINAVKRSLVRDKREVREGAGGNETGYRKHWMKADDRKRGGRRRLHVCRDVAEAIPAS